MGSSTPSDSGTYRTQRSAALITKPGLLHFLAGRDDFDKALVFLTTTPSHFYPISMTITILTATVSTSTSHLSNLGIDTIMNVNHWNHRH